MAAKLPLADVKVLDLMWVMAGPAGSRVLADYGATVVHVESTHRFDTARTLQPVHKGDFGPESSALFQDVNAGKLGITLALDKEEGRAVVRDLVRWADVVTESFSPKAMRAWGLHYQALREIKPDIIMLSSCLMGQTGPLARFAGFGNLAAAISGFFNLCGWADRPPSGPFGAYTDYVAPRFTAVSILAALEYRRRTGRGQYIDQSQGESALHFLGPALLDYTVNGRVQSRLGNYDPQIAPHGVYPAAGDDRWVAIACRDDDQWRVLTSAMGHPELAQDKRFATLGLRLENHDELDQLIGQWSRTLHAERIEELLQSVRVPASVVQNSAEMYRDPQLKHRGHFVRLDHPTYGHTVVENSRIKLSRTPARVERAAPTMGRDTQYVLAEILHYSDDKITELATAGALE